MQAAYSQYKSKERSIRIGKFGARVVSAAERDCSVWKQQETETLIARNAFFARFGAPILASKCGASFWSLYMWTKKISPCGCSWVRFWRAVFRRPICFKFHLQKPHLVPSTLLHHAILAFFSNQCVVSLKFNLSRCKNSKHKRSEAALIVC